MPQDLSLALAARNTAVRPSGLSLVPADCCICGDEEADPVAVGQDFDRETGGDSFLARRCRGCGLVYLDPAPSVEDHLSLGRGLRHERGHSARRWATGESAGTRVLEINDPEQDANGAPGAYDLILLDRVLERALQPRDLLLNVRRMLAPGGRVVVVALNTGSIEFALFGDRHWSGYHFPRHRQLFGSAPLRGLARATGLAVVSVTTAHHSAGWLRSLRNLGLDWGLPRFVTRLLPLAWPGCVALEALGRLNGRASLLVAVLGHPSGPRSGG
jgi:SAM-dependent methyltransferase